MSDGKSSEVSTGRCWEYFGRGESERSADPPVGLSEACGQLTEEMTTGEGYNTSALASDRRAEVGER